MAGFVIEPLHPDFGARLTGVSLRPPLDDGLVAEIREAIDRYSFLVFPGQPFDDEAQLALTRQFGEPEANHTTLGQEGRIEFFATIGNVQPDGTVYGARHKRSIFLTGNNMWHSDSSFRAVPTFISIMCAYEVPETGGETLFASQRAAYARLPAAMRQRIDPLVVVHDYVFSRSKVAPDAVTPSHAASLPPVRQRLVRRNPANDARNYYVGSHARAIEGWSEGDSRALIDELLACATGEEAVITHAWQPGELAIWDNRCLLHRGAGYDADRYRRRMRQTRVTGTGPTLAE